MELYSKLLLYLALFFLTNNIFWRSFHISLCRFTLNFLIAAQLLLYGFAVIYITSPMLVNTEQNAEFLVFQTMLHEIL